MFWEKFPNETNKEVMRPQIRIGVIKRRSGGKSPQISRRKGKNLQIRIRKGRKSPQIGIGGRGKSPQSTSRRGGKPHKSGVTLQGRALKSESESKKNR